MNKQVHVTVSTGENPCIHIENSYLITRGIDIKDALVFIHTTKKYKELKASGYTRTLTSEYREWKAHNVLYRLGIERARTAHVDIAQNESKFRRFVYALLSIF